VILQDTFTLQNQLKIPKIGLGTWQSSPEDAYKAVKIALENGYRHVDTAAAYKNEEAVGKAVRDSGLPREEIFVTTKVPAELKSYQEALEEAYLSGKVKSIGVSNFDEKDLQNIFDHCDVKPMVNQYIYHIGRTNEDLLTFCKENDILVEGYSPIATGRLLDNEEIQQIADRYDASIPQVSIRYLLQKGILPLPKSVHEAYIIDNAKVDFEISDEDMTRLEQIDA